MLKALTPAQVKQYKGNGPLIYCCCGCKSIFPQLNENGEPRYYLPGHNLKGTRKSFEEREKLSKSKRGKKRSRDVRRKIGDSLRGRKNRSYAHANN